MRHFINLCCLFCALQLPAQTAYYTNLLSQWNSQYSLSGGTWVIASNEQQVQNAVVAYGGATDLLTVSGQPFTRANQLTIPIAGNNPWDAALFVTNTMAIAAGDKLLVTMWIRSAGSTPGLASLYIEHVDTYDKEAYFTVNVSTEWKRLTLPIAANNDYPVGKLRFGFQVGLKAQTLQFGGFAVRNYANAYTLMQLPTDLQQDYAGSEPDAPWRAEAAARIEQIRKADLDIIVQDANGNPVSGAQVKVKMLQHQFKFGSAVVGSHFAGNNSQNNTYQAKMLNFDGQGHGFNEVVFENDLKWEAWEGQWGVSHAQLVKAVKWLKDRNISIRGHNLVWPGWQYLPSYMVDNQSDPAFLKNKINARIQEMLTFPGLAGQIADWDVLNEITTNEDLANAFQGTPDYPTGREIYQDILHKVKAADPNMPAYLNDYVTLDQGYAPGNPTYDKCKAYLQEVFDSGAPFEGIGFQGHIGAGLLSMYDTKNTLDDFYNTFGKRAKITEFDISDLVSDSLAAKFTGDFLTLCFSHPSVDGFMSWGFWDGAHWHGNAPYFRLNWTMKPTGQRVAQLLFQDWWTPEVTLTADANGMAHLRGFKGIYEITQICSGQVQVIDTLQLFDNQQIALTCLTAATGTPDGNDLQVEMPSPVQAGAMWMLRCSEAPAQVRLLGADGRVVQIWQKPTAAFGVQVNVAGMYWLEVVTKNGGKAVKTVVVE